MVVHICVFDSQGLLIQQRSRERPSGRRHGMSAAGGMDAGDSRQARSGVPGGSGRGPGPDGSAALCTVNFDGGFDDFFLVSGTLAWRS